MFKVIVLFMAILGNTPLGAIQICHYEMDEDKGAVATGRDTLTNNQDSSSIRMYCSNDSAVLSDIKTDSLLYYRILHVGDSIKVHSKQIYQNDAFKFKSDFFREKMKEPWIGDILKNILFR